MLAKPLGLLFTLSLVSAFDWSLDSSDCNSFSYTMTLEEREKDAATYFAVVPGINNDQGIYARISDQFGSSLSVSLQQTFDTPLTGSVNDVLVAIGLFNNVPKIISYPGSKSNDPDQATVSINLTCNPSNQGGSQSTSAEAPASTTPTQSSLVATSSTIPLLATSTSAGPPIPTGRVTVEGMRCAYRDDCNSRCFTPGYAIGLPNSAGYTIGLADPRSGNTYELTCKGLSGPNALINGNGNNSTGSTSTCGSGSKSNNYFCQCTYDHYLGACDPSRPGADTAAKLSPQHDQEGHQDHDSALPFVNNFSNVLVLVLSVSLSLLLL